MPISLPSAKKLLGYVPIGPNGPVGGHSMSPRYATPHDVRQACRNDSYSVFPSTTIDGYLCTNIVMMHQRYAAHLQPFVRRIRKLPLMPIAGARPRRDLARCDVCTDLRSYDVLRDGEHVAQPLR